jgi:hypothetical protein
VRQLQADRLPMVAGFLLRCCIRHYNKDPKRVKWTYADPRRRALLRHYPFQGH